MPTKRPSSRTPRTSEPRNRPKPPTAKQRRSFVAALECGWSIRRACIDSGIPRRTAYDLRDRNAEFARQWDDALVAGLEVLEDEAVRRAVEGVEDFRLDRHGDEHPVRRYSDGILTFLMKHRMRAKYGDRAELAIGGADGGPVEIRLAFDPKAAE